MQQAPDSGSAYELTGAERSLRIGDSRKLPEAEARLRVSGLPASPGTLKKAMLSRRTECSSARSVLLGLQRLAGNAAVVDLLEPAPLIRGRDQAMAPFSTTCGGLVQRQHHASQISFPPMLRTLRDLPLAGFRIQREDGRAFHGRAGISDEEWLDSFLDFFEFHCIVPRMRGDPESAGLRSHARFAGILTTLGEIADLAVEQAQLDGRRLQRGPTLTSIVESYEADRDSGGSALQVGGGFVPTTAHLGLGSGAGPPSFDLPGINLSAAVLRPFHRTDGRGWEVSVILPQVALFGDPSAEPMGSAFRLQSLLAGGQLAHVWPVSGPSSTTFQAQLFLQVLGGLALPHRSPLGQVQGSVGGGFAWVIPIEDAQLQIMLQVASGVTHTWFPASAMPGDIPTTLDFTGGLFIALQYPGFERRSRHPQPAEPARP